MKVGFSGKTGNTEITEIALDWSRSIRRRSDAVLLGQIGKDADLRPEAMDGAFSGRPAKPVASRCESRLQSTAIELFSVSRENKKAA